MSQRLLVLGAGAVGGYFGGRLAESGADVTFLVRPPRERLLKDKGLRIISPYGDAHAAVKTIVAGDTTTPFDAVLLTSKAYDLPDAVEAIRPYLGRVGYVLPVLNGVAHLDVLNRAFGADRVLGGTVKIQATLTADGSIRQFNDWNSITFGEQSGEMSERIAALQMLFAPTIGVAALSVPDIIQRMWEKLVHLSTAATMTCLMRANVGEILRTPDGGALFLRQLQNSADIAAAAGHRPSPAFMALWRETFSQRDSQYSTSMLRDIERGGRTEVDHVIGFMLEGARAAGLEHETLLLAFTHIKAFEQRRAAGRLP